MRYFNGTVDPSMYTIESTVADRRSVTSDQICLSILQSGAITWNSKKQPTVALSTTEAEYMAMSSPTQEAIWLGNFGYFGKTKEDWSIYKFWR